MSLKKKLPRVRVRWRDRASDTARAHPKITLGVIGAIVGILGVVVPWGIAWEDRYQRKIDAAREAEAMRHEIRVGDARSERAQAWSRYGQARTEAIVLRNRLNDCAVQVAAGKKQTPLEIAVCGQYDDEYREADARAKEARAAAQKAGP
jgi:hypothetical protein